MKEIKEKHFQLVRSKKTLPKLKQFKVNPRLEQLKRAPSAPLEHGEVIMIQGGAGAQMSRDGTSSEAEELILENQENPIKKALQTVVSSLRLFFKHIFGFIFSHRYHLDDIINIFRPFIYVYLVMKHGRKSYTPIRISFILDVISILITFSRLIQASNPEQQRRP